MRKAHQIWIEQCEAAQAIRTRFGLKAAFNYIVSDKLQNFAEASLHHSEFARELPRFVSEVRQMFTRDEIETELADLEKAENEEVADCLLDDDDAFPEDTAASVERARQFDLIKELLKAGTLGTA